MAEERLLSIARLPTLTEVLELGAEVAVRPHPPWVEPLPLAPGTVPGSAATDDEQLVKQVLAELEPRIAAQLESRLREALAPALARAVEGLIVDARHELSASLRGLVEETVARVLRGRGER